MSREQLEAHLQFLAELGVEGFRREPEWRTRVLPDATPVGRGLPTPPEETPVPLDAPDATPVGRVPLDRPDDTLVGRVPLDPPTIYGPAEI